MAEEIVPVGPSTARVMIVGDFPHAIDLAKGQPFVGGAGFELTKLLAEAGIHRERCFITMVQRSYCSGSDIDNLVAAKKSAITHAHTALGCKYVVPSVMAGVRKLEQEIKLVKPNVIVACGNLALLVLTGEWGVRDWRSSIMECTLVPGVKVIPTLNPMTVVQQWSMRPIMLHDLKRAARESAFPEIRRTKYEFTIRPTFEVAKDTLGRLLQDARTSIASGQGRLSVGADIETRAGHTACLAFSWSATEAICIPFMCVTNPEGYWSEEEEAELVFLIYQICREVKIIGQNWNYDAQYFWRHWHFICPDVEDTMIQQHSCFSNMEKNLAFLSSMYLEDHLYWKDDRTNWKEGPKGEGEDQYWIYNCTDAVRTWAIHKVLKQVVKAMGLEAVNDFQQALAPVVLETMNMGVRIDTEARAKFSVELQAEAAKRVEFLQDVIGYPINIGSPVQLKKFFYEEMGVKPVTNRKTGGVSTDDESLKIIAEREPLLAPITKKIAELRSLGVFHSTFVMAGLDTDGRMRTSFNVCGTETYRFASTKNAFGTGLNMQNTSAGGQVDGSDLELPNIRKLFIPDPGHTFFDIDLDSADLRIVTWESGCEWMKEQFRNGRKPYVEIMKEYYHDQSITKQHKSYPMFKALCHGTNYLGTPKGLAGRIGLNVHETERIQKWYYGLCPEILTWQSEIQAQVAGRRWIQNAFGYRQHLFDRIEGTIFNQAVAWIPQSTVACLINRAYVNIHRNLPEVAVLLQVHDSLAGQFESVHGDWALRRIVEESEVSIPYADPLIIPVGIKYSTRSWGDCE